MPDDKTPISTTTNHLFDDPSLSSLDFLLSVMHSSEVDLADRIKAAEVLLPFIAPKPQPTVRPWYTNGIPCNEDVTIKVVIEGLGTIDQTNPAACESSHAGAQ
jgi:hypothetical protein